MVPHTEIHSAVCYAYVCFAPPVAHGVAMIFGFSQFLTAVALLAVIYTITDTRYKFRIAVAPGPLYRSTFIMIIAIGIATLITQVWVAQGWWVPETWGLTLPVWQGGLGLLFLGTFITWMYYAFIKPPVFGKRNAIKYGQELYRYLLRGYSMELQIIASELARSIAPLVKYAHVRQSTDQDANTDKSTSHKPSVHDYAHDILLLIGNRKLCREIVAVSPVTAQIAFEEVLRLRKYDLPLGVFARNISSEAILQRESFLYVEAEGYESGLLGYLKPVSQAVYKHYGLVEALGHHAGSPLDISYKEYRDWDPSQWEGYCRAILYTLDDFLTQTGGSVNSPVLNRAFGHLSFAFNGIYKLDGLEDFYESPIYKSYETVVTFATDAIKLLSKHGHLVTPICKVHEGTYPKTIYDHIAHLLFDLCFYASSVKGPPDTSWWIQHNALWGEVFDFDDSKPARIVRAKLCRLLYDEVIKLNRMPNFKGARILGFCLNILGVVLTDRKRKYFRDTYALTRVTQNWAHNNYLNLRRNNPSVADAVLIGSISYDEGAKKLVKTYAKNLHDETPKEYLELVDSAS